MTRGEDATQRGLFIVFEGIDGSGKSTQVRRLADNFRRQGVHVRTTAEPTASPVGSLIRNAFAHRVNLDDETIAALFVADRLDHVINGQDGMLLSISDGVTVISDRYHLSSHAYHDGDVGGEWVAQANSLATELLRPDLTFFLDINVDEALIRLNKRSSIPDRFEHRTKLESARNSYISAIGRFGKKDNVRVISATRSTEAVADEIWRQVSLFGSPINVG